jgi:fluoride exporter
MKVIFLVAAGGALGAVTRHLVVQTTSHFAGTSFGWGTLLVNVLGSFIMGLLAAALLKTVALEPTLRPLLMTGFLGAFTTFSAFSLDAQRLWERQEILSLFLYIAASVVLSLASLWAGIRAWRLFQG